MTTRFVVWGGQKCLSEVRNVECLSIIFQIVQIIRGQAVQLAMLSIEVHLEQYGGQVRKDAVLKGTYDLLGCRL